MLSSPLAHGPWQGLVGPDGTGQFSFPGPFCVVFSLVFLLIFSFSSPFRRRGRVPLCIHLHWKCPMFSYLLAEDNVTIYVMAEKKKRHSQHSGELLEGHLNQLSIMDAKKLLAETRASD